MVQTRSRSKIGGNSKSSEADFSSPPKVSSRRRSTGPSTKKARRTPSRKSKEEVEETEQADVWAEEREQESEQSSSNEDEISQVKDILASVAEDGEDIDQTMMEYSHQTSGKNPLYDDDEEDDEDEEEEVETEEEDDAFEHIDLTKPEHEEEPEEEEPRHAPHSQSKDEDSAFSTPRKTLSPPADLHPSFRTPNRMRQAKNEEESGLFPFDFGGPVGTAALTVLLPAFLLFLQGVCMDEDRKAALSLSSETCLPPLHHFASLDSAKAFALSFAEAFRQLPLCELVFSHKALYVFLGWFAYQVVLERFLPAKIAVAKSSGLAYRVNAHLVFWVTVLLLSTGLPSLNPSLKAVDFYALPLAELPALFLPLLGVSVLLTTAMSLWFYVRSFLPTRGDTPRVLAHGGNSGHPFYDFFKGRELNPRIGCFDWKYFCELRPGLIGWMVLNLGFLFAQLQETGSVTPAMFLVTLFQGFYVWDALYHEEAILSTMDITTDGFGFMLCFGDLSWVPFLYSLQARYLYIYNPTICPSLLLAATLIHFLGYYIFRASNSEKDAFRKNPNSPEVAHLSYLQTGTGRRLITSGWWGSARKINYTGDWLVALSWALLCGFDSAMPYVHILYFTALLITRAMRDNEDCKKKYGDDWDRYTQEVPYVFVPGLF